MKKILLLAALFLTVQLQAQITGLSGWNIVIDPGHSADENMGIYNYPEAQKSLYVGRHLRAFLQDSTDIDTVYMTRTDSIQIVSLSQRTDYANSLGAAWFHSLHSDAGGASANTTLLLWGQYASGAEKIPNGGKAMSDIMIGNLTKGMRTTTVRGSIGDCSFYGCTSGGPYLWVNRMSNMPSELSEAGFHTNPKQNQLNMNYEWKRLEAKTFWWSIIKFKGQQRPYPGIMAGIVTDSESGLPINGAVVTVNGRTYTTDTYQSLFHKYSTDSTLLRNGFYYFERVPGGIQSISVSAPGYDTYNSTVAMSDTFFTFKDVAMVNSMPPYVATVLPAVGDSLYPGINNLQITFSRPMDTASVNNALVFAPTVGNPQKSWSANERTLVINTSGFQFATNYTLTILATAKDKSNHPLDGNGDGVGGDPYVMNFSTRVPDQVPPALVARYPQANEQVIEKRPVINLTFNEPLKTSTLGGKIFFTNTSTGANVQTLTKYYPGTDFASVNLFTREDLVPGTQYLIKIEPGIEDMSGNAIQEAIEIPFTMGSIGQGTTYTIDNFDGGIGNWWVPQQSGSTVGILTDTTNIYLDGVILNHGTGSAKSMKLTYGWDLLATQWLIREYYPATTPTFPIQNTYLETMLFGDGSGNKFRFCVNDGGPGGHEVSEWKTIDWYGWKLVRWDLANDPVGSWIGNGVLESPLSIDSYQLTLTPGKKNIGTLYFDDLQYTVYGPVDVQDELSGVPGAYGLSQNFPNPFNPSTVIKYAIPVSGNVEISVYNALGQKVKTLVDGFKEAGNYQITFEAGDLPSGLYLYELRSGVHYEVKKMLLMK
ncbi:MAG: Ig-like domain-containing protein [Ignavibacteriales bacterium]|nr:MAG: T9SS type A sorting domain-containing protein [Ignavibacteriaceae bacterium]MBW7873130.1 Ig-like domain-containing protein [Ignavibacteria bacterium]MCZ2142772.1 Ig-like domain-containing protein [Ignavibacteriales bacterium]OQY74485.1 MAG: hypothetical protein B6D45_06865 [Ignavibacteriales bacterium UTCHB3]MBV6443866.1 hypothetical protein [Ignavibacteriaceae bacterium]